MNTHISDYISRQSHHVNIYQMVYTLFRNLSSYCRVHIRHITAITVITMSWKDYDDVPRLLSFIGQRSRNDCLFMQETKNLSFYPEEEESNYILRLFSQRFHIWCFMIWYFLCIFDKEIVYLYILYCIIINLKLIKSYNVVKLQ